MDLVKVMVVISTVMGLIGCGSDDESTGPDTQSSSGEINGSDRSMTVGISIEGDYTDGSQEMLVDANGRSFKISIDTNGVKDTFEGVFFSEDAAYDDGTDIAVDRNYCVHDTGKQCDGLEEIRCSLTPNTVDEVDCYGDDWTTLNISMPSTSKYVIGVVCEIDAFLTIDPETCITDMKSISIIQ